MANTIDTGTEIRQVSSLTPGLTSKRQNFTEIPLLDFSAMASNFDEKGDDEKRQALADDLFHACANVGFFYVKNHGVSPQTIEQLLSASTDFFSQSEARKLEIDIANSSFSRGYIPIFGEKNNAKTKGDVKETFDMAIDIDAHDPDFKSGNPLYGPNQWPSQLPHFKPALNQYFSEITQLSHKLYAAFAMALNLPVDYFDGYLKKPLDILRLLRYPPQPVVEDEDQIGTGAHSDFDCFTILWQDNSGGLQVLNSEGVWIDATPIDNTFLVNIGDMMERWTNGQFISTVHRVINRSAKERFSVVFFVAPDYSTSIACLPSCLPRNEAPKFDPVSAGDYIVSRYNEILA